MEEMTVSGGIIVVFFVCAYIHCNFELLVVGNIVRVDV